MAKAGAGLKTDQVKAVNKPNKLSAKIGFNQAKYLELQTEAILERVGRFERLYLEVGGKLVDDLHAKRVLPGFDPAAKLKVLGVLKNQIEAIVCVSAIDLERNRIRADNHLSYADEAIRMIKVLRQHNIKVSNVVITLFDNQPRVKPFQASLAKLDLAVHTHSRTAGYPTDIEMIVSERGYGQNSFVQTERKIVVVTAPGSSSGKMATCLSQIYHEAQRGKMVGYAKYETFPVWDLPLDHPVNLAYEAATLDSLDTTMIDPFHLAAYDKTAVNYNRDVETFPVLKRIFDRIYGREIYQSPTDMGVNMIAPAICDINLVEAAAKEEIIRRYFNVLLQNKLGEASSQSLERAKLLMESTGIQPLDRLSAKLAFDKLKSLQLEDPFYENQAAAVELVGGRTATGKKTPVLTPVAATVLNILKVVAEIDDAIYLLPPEVLEPIADFKCNKLGMCESELSLEEVLLALTILTATNPLAKIILNKLDQLDGAQLHSTSLLSDRDLLICQHLGIDVTTGRID